MYENTKSFFYKSAQQRIQQRVEKINEERMKLKEAGKVQYKNLKKIRASHIYPNKPVAIKKILTGQVDDTENFLSLAIASAILQNVKLIENRHTNSTDSKLEHTMKEENLEFLNLQEPCWGSNDYLFSFEGQFYFFFYLFSDLIQSDEYSRKIIEQTLMRYIPYASTKAYREGLNENQNLDFLIGSYKNDNVDVFAEAIFLFCKAGESNEVMITFIDLIYSKFLYESKDSDGRYLKKETEAGFHVFDKLFDRFVKEKMLPILESSDSSDTLGKRVYDLLINDLFRMGSRLSYMEMSLGPEAYDRYLTIAEQPEMDVMKKLNQASENYIDELNKVQIDMVGNVELEYFNSDVFMMREGENYFSLDRYTKLDSERTEGLVEQFEQEQIEEWEK